MVIMSEPRCADAALGRPMNALAPSSARNPDNQRFLMLDFMRGIAALSVLVYHDGQCRFLGVQLLPNAYLAVDMFFLLSGFVIAHNYDRKITSGMSLSDFLAQRLIRLYPCLLLTLLLGIAVYALRETRNHGFLDFWRILGAAGLNGLYLPAYIHPYSIDDDYPFDGAAWSLTFELVANLVYWLTFRALGRRATLAGMIVLSAVVLAIPAFLFGCVDVGMRPSELWWGVPRVLLSFFIGVGLRRHVYPRVHINLARSAAALVLCTLLIVFTGSLLLGGMWGGMADLVVLCAVFPLLIVAVGSATPGPVTARIAKLVGDASYPVYLIQNPFVGVTAAVPQFLWGMKAAQFQPAVGIAHIIATVLCALWVDRYFELPARRILKERWQAFRASTAPVAAAAGGGPRS